MSSAEEGRCWIGFDLGGTKMLCAAFNDRLEQITQKRKKTRAHEGAESGLQRLCKLIDEVLDKAGCTRQQLAGIGVGVPGPVDLDAGIVREAPNLGWRDLPLADLLREEFGCPVLVANDVDLGVYGEYHAGAGQGAHCVVGVFPGTGIGGGCVYEGKIFRGRSISCMEIGHIPILLEGPLCGCGLRGCLEAVASRLSVSAAAAAAAYRGQAPFLHKESKTAISSIRSSTLAAAIEAGDEAVLHILQTAAEYIGRGVATLVHLIAPDIVVLGGGLVEAMPRLLCDTVEETARRHTLSSMRETFRVVVAELGDDAAITGAAAWAKKNIAAE